MVKLAATSVIRGSCRGESHGGIHIVDLEDERVYKPVDWNKENIDWQGHGGDRGLRGIAFRKDRVFFAASDTLFECNPDFNLVVSYQNPYLKHCHDVSIHGHHLFITSAAYDSILAFNLRKNTFDMALMLQTDGQNLSIRRYNPNSDDGPLPMNKFHLNSVFCDAGGMYMSGLRTEALLLYNGKRVGISATLPAGTRNARPFREGILFNDTESNKLRYASRSGSDDCAFDVPQTESDVSPAARPKFARGLCAISDTMIAAGSSPSTIALYDLDQRKMVKTVSLSTDIRHSIHSLAVWPY